jgi:hypothetical protein
LYYFELFFFFFEQTFILLNIKIHSFPQEKKVNFDSAHCSLVVVHSGEKVRRIF